MIGLKVPKSLTLALSIFVLGACTGNSGGVIVGENNTDAKETLRVDVQERYRKYEREQGEGSKFIRLWVTQESDSFGSGSSGSKYGSGVKRNVGYIRPQSLENTWYFTTNSQNIVDLSDLISVSEDQSETWLGTIYSVVSRDSDDNGRLNSRDKVDLYYAKDAEFSLIYEGADRLEEVFTDVSSSTLFIRKGDDVIAANLDYQTLLLQPIRKIEVPQ